MQIESENNRVAVSLTSAEAQRLAIALEAACEALSQAEFYIRTGLSRDNIRQVAAMFSAAAAGESPDEGILVTAGVEAVENPRRPRPPRPSD